MISCDILRLTLILLYRYFVCAWRIIISESAKNCWAAAKNSDRKLPIIILSLTKSFVELTYCVSLFPVVLVCWSSLLQDNGRSKSMPAIKTQKFKTTCCWFGPQCDRESLSRYWNLQCKTYLEHPLKSSFEVSRKTKKLFF